MFTAGKSKAAGAKEVDLGDGAGSCQPQKNQVNTVQTFTYALMKMQTQQSCERHGCELQGSTLMQICVRSTQNGAVKVFSLPYDVLNTFSFPQFIFL